VNRIAQLANYIHLENGLPKVKSTANLSIAKVLDNRIILGRQGVHKIEIIEKIQAFIRGFLARKSFKL
jgi:hypothetical protein